MTYEQVLVFHTIIRSGSFKAAADAMHKTQPAISSSIKKLEEELEIQLFDRSNYRPELTLHGKAFYEKSLKLLNGMQELEGLGQSFRQKEEPEISISVDGISYKPEILKFFKAFSDRHPHTKLNLSFDILSEAQRRVMEKEALFGITHFLHDLDSVEVVPLTQVQMVPVMSQELFQERTVTSENDLREIDQIVVGDKNGPKGASFGLLEGGKKWRLNDSNFKREIIQAGLGWGHLPQHVIERELKDKKLVILNFENIHPRTLEINLIRLKRVPFGPVAKKLWEELITSFSGRA